MKVKKILINVLPLLFVGGIMAYAAAPSGGYLPNATLDPDCAPWDTDCFVQIQMFTDTNPWFGDDDDAVATDNTEDIYAMGNVGIGTTDPQQLLHMASLGNRLIMEDTDGVLWGSISTAIEFQANWVQHGRVWFPGTAQWIMYYDNNAGSIYMDADRNNTNTGAIIRFGLHGDEQMRIHNNGNVGIGTSSPGQRLHVSDGNILGLSAIFNRTDDVALRNHLVFQRTGNAVAAPASTPQFNIATLGDGAWDLDEMRFTYYDGTTTSSSMTIEKNGNIGMGTVDPESKLHINTLAWNIGVKIQKSTGNAGKAQILLDENRPTNNAHQKAIQMTNGSWSTVEIGALHGPGWVTSYFYIDVDESDVWDNAYVNSDLAIAADGNVGIGTATPDSKLSIVGLPSGTDDSVTPGSLAWAVCITDQGNMYIDSDGTCSN